MDIIDQILNNFIIENNLRENFHMSYEINRKNKFQKPRLGIFISDNFKKKKIVREK